MEDKMVMEDLLNAVKGVADLYLHGTIESATPNVHTTFNSTLSSTLQMQNQIYNKMSEKGWYPMEQAEQQQIEKVKQKYIASSN